MGTWPPPGHLPHQLTASPPYPQLKKNDVPMFFLDYPLICHKNCLVQLSREPYAWV